MNTVLIQHSIDSLYGATNAIRLIRSPGSGLTGNEITNSTGGFLISESGSCEFRNNVVKDTYVFGWGGSGFGVVGYKLEDFTQNIDASNTIECKPIYYLQNIHGISIDPSNYPMLLVIWL